MEPKDWKVGDVIRCLVEHSSVHIGLEYSITEVRIMGGSVTVEVEGVESRYWASAFEFVRRPEAAERIRMGKDGDHIFIGYQAEVVVGGDNTCIGYKEECEKADSERLDFKQKQIEQQTYCSCCTKAMFPSCEVDGFQEIFHEDPCHYDSSERYMLPKIKAMFRESMKRRSDEVRQSVQNEDSAMRLEQAESILQGHRKLGHSVDPMFPSIRNYQELTGKPQEIKC